MNTDQDRVNDLTTNPSPNPDMTSQQTHTPTAPASTITVKKELLSLVAAYRHAAEQLRLGLSALPTALAEGLEYELYHGPTEWLDECFDEYIDELTGQLARAREWGSLATRARAALAHEKDRRPHSKDGRAERTARMQQLKMLLSDWRDLVVRGPATEAEHGVRRDIEMLEGQLQAILVGENSAEPQTDGTSRVSAARELGFAQDDAKEVDHG